MSWAHSNNVTTQSIADAMLPHTTNTYWHEFGQISQYNGGLNYFEKLWAAWYAYIGNDVLATGIMSFVMHETVYFGRSLPWIIIDRIPYFNQYKIQHVSCVKERGKQKWILTNEYSTRFLQQKSNGTAQCLCF